MIPTYWQKVGRDLLLEGTRTVLVVTAIALGILGLTTVLSAHAILTRELNQAYLATNPASARLRLDSIDDAVLAAMRSNPEIAAAEARKTISGRIKAGAGTAEMEWKPIRLFVLQDYRDIRIATLELKKGVWPPARGEVLIERDSFQVAQLHMGDTVAVKIPGTPERTLRITGSVLDVGQAQSRMEDLVYGYITPDTLAYLGQEGPLDELLIRVAGGELDERHIRAVADDAAKTARNLGHTVRRLDVPPPGVHPHASIMGLLLLFMSAFGICILALSGILVVNLITALLSSQVRQIGVMKALGATRAKVALIYLSQALALGICAIAVGLPAGILGGWYLSKWLAVFLNFDLASLASPVWVYLLAATAGLAVPLLSAAYPVWKGSGIPVRKALDDFGVSSGNFADNFGDSAFDRLLAGARGLSPAGLLVLRNSFRQRTRLVLTVATLFAGGVLFLSGLNLRTSLVYTLDRLFESRKFDLSVTLGAMSPLEKVERIVLQTPGIRRTEGWIVMDATVAAEGSRFPVVGLPPQTALQQVDIAEGRGLQPGDTNALVLNTALASRGPQMRVGNTVTLQVGTQETPMRIVGIARERMSSETAYVSRDYVDHLNGGNGQVNSVRVLLDQTGRESLNRARLELEQNFEHEQIRAQVSSTKDGRYAFDQHMLMIYVFLVVVSGMIAVIGGLGLMTTMSLNVIERRREMGILRTIGASPPVIWVLIVTEGVFIGTLSWAAATLASWPLSVFLGNLLIRFVIPGGMDFKFAPEGILIWFVVSISLGAVASFTPAWHAARLTVREALTRG